MGWLLSGVLGVRQETDLLKPHLLGLDSDGLFEGMRYIYRRSRCINGTSRCHLSQ